MKLLLYCTKATKQKDLLWSNNLKHFFLDGAYNRLIDNLPEYLLNGKIVAECDFEVEKIDCKKADKIDRFYKYSRLTYRMLDEYLKGNNGYAIHIKNLHIFDEPYELGKTLIYNFNNQYIVDKAPQNMMKVYNRAGECHILISIRPEWLCKILNGEKTIECRKRILKEMMPK